MVNSVNTIYSTSIFPQKFSLTFALFLNDLTFPKQRELLPNLIQPQAVHMLALCKFSCDWLKQPIFVMDLTNQRLSLHRISLWLD